MKQSNKLIFLMAFLFGITGAIASEYRQELFDNAYGKKPVPWWPDPCRVGTLNETNCGETSGIQCTVTIDSDVVAAYADSNCTNPLWRPI